MRQFETYGLVLRENRVGEKDKQLNILTAEHGKLRVWAKGAQNAKSKLLAGCQQFSYAYFSLYASSPDYIIVQEAKAQEVFYELRKDILKLALAQYFAQITDYMFDDRMGTSDALRIFLNCLYALAKTGRDIKVIKPAFEMRLLASEGVYPELSSCRECGRSAADMVFDAGLGIILCPECAGRQGPLRPSSFPLSSGAVAAMNHIIKCDMSKLLSFEIPKTAKNELYDAASAFCSYHTGRDFSTLRFFESML